MYQIPIFAVLGSQNFTARAEVQQLRHKLFGIPDFAGRVAKLGGQNVFFFLPDFCRGQEVKSPNSPQSLDRDLILPETNIAPENGWLEYKFPFGMAHFQGLC